MRACVSENVWTYMHVFVPVCVQICVRVCAHLCVSFKSGRPENGCGSSRCPFSFASFSSSQCRCQASKRRDERGCKKALITDKKTMVERHRLLERHRQQSIRFPLSLSSGAQRAALGLGTTLRPRTSAISSRKRGSFSKFRLQTLRICSLPEAQRHLRPIHF